MCLSYLNIFCYFRCTTHRKECSIIGLKHVGLYQATTKGCFCIKAYETVGWINAASTQNRETREQFAIGSIRLLAMQINLSLIYVCMLVTCASCKVTMTGYRLVYTDRQFPRYFKGLKVNSEEECSLYCRINHCASFAFSLSDFCSLNRHPIHENRNEANVIYKKEQGTKMFTYSGKPQSRKASPNKLCY